MKKEGTDIRIVYNDVPLFLLLLPFINALNYYLTYTNISFNWHTALTFTIDTLQGYAAWWTIRSIIIHLDRKLPHQPKPVKRILIQLLVTSMAGLAVIIITTEIINAIAKDTPVPSDFYKYDIFIFLIWFFVINGIYIGLHYYKLWHESETQRNHEKRLRKEGFIIKQGKQHLNIPFSEIASVYLAGEYAMLLTVGSKKHLLDQSLDNVEKQLPVEHFFRLNRQHILHRKMITGFERAENGKLNILVVNTHHPSVPLQVSRTKASAFKAWFNAQN
ncbi:LytR/AlgR family response regulator transcription factor [Segetibacter aerophilus]|uniref:HTH LytTR-type domain-containing protein n=1 Tax=Segetibacter aerophilus TaxID=670293 RepID=A0A512BBJ8_9BACT|nr:LytTR family DNA-binding domain-containing protein [Segetibacter aerophilus]GEO09255.1 hypothetical protein SAE01_17510 [Segetibacter aerophilus]